MKTHINPWQEIPLSDYEAHMANRRVGQHQLLNSLTKKYLDLLKPVSCLFLGVAGGNGLEHIDNKIVKSVYAIDINQQYLDKTYERFHQAIKQLYLLNIDISQNTGTICRADFVWAALILEYTAINPALLFSKNNLTDGGQIIVTIQSNNGVTTVSDTGIRSLNKLSPVFSVIDKAVLINQAVDTGFELISSEENFLPNGKSLVTVRFKNSLKIITPKRAG